MICFTRTAREVKAEGETNSETTNLLALLTFAQSAPHMRLSVFKPLLLNWWWFSLKGLKCLGCLTSSFPGSWIISMDFYMWKIVLPVQLSPKSGQTLTVAARWMLYVEPHWLVFLSQNSALSVPRALVRSIFTNTFKYTIKDFILFHWNHWEIWHWVQ